MNSRAARRDNYGAVEKKNVLAVAASKKLKAAKSIIEGVGRGVFPAFSKNKRALINITDGTKMGSLLEHQNLSDSQPKQSDTSTAEWAPLEPFSAATCDSRCHKRSHLRIGV